VVVLGCGLLLSPPLESVFLAIFRFRGVGYAVRYSGIQLDTARYVRIQLDTVGYSGIQWICCKMNRYRIDTGINGIPKDSVKYRQDTGEIQAGHPKNTRQGRASLVLRVWRGRGRGFLKDFD